MADSILERIMQNVEATLLTITTGGGYSATIQQVQRSTDPNLETATFPFIWLPEPPEESEDQPLGLSTKIAHLILWIWISNNTTPPHKVLNNLIGDVEKALLIDHTRGGLAVDTDIRGLRSEFGKTAEPFLNADVQIDIHYRHKYGDPFTLI